MVLKMGTLLFPFGEGEPKGGPIQVVIFRSFKPEEMEAAAQKNLKVGAAYLMTDDGEFKYIKDVDLKLENHELAKQFGVDSKN